MFSVPAIVTAAAAKSLQLCLTLCDPMDCNLPGSSAYGIFQARVLEWGAIAFSSCSYYLMPNSALEPKFGKDYDAGKDGEQEEMWATEDEVVSWHY